MTEAVYMDCWNEEPAPPGMSSTRDNHLMKPTDTTPTDVTGDKPDNPAPMRLTEEEREELDAINDGEIACDDGLKIALGSHAALMRDINGQRRAWWRRLGARLGFDPWDGHRVRGMEVMRVERVEEDGE